MTFFVDAPWHGADGVASVMVARYAGHPTGQRVEPRQARSARRGEACWAGTTATAARVVMRVERFRSRTLAEGKRTWHPRAYAVRGLASMPPMAPTYKGSLGAQDAYPCGPVPSARTAARAQGRGGTTQLTVRIPRCDGCRVRLGQWSHVTRTPWRTAERTVRHGRARFTVPSGRTHGMEVAVTAPWEGATGYQTFAVFRYGDRQPGQQIGFSAARRQRKGSACWAGTAASRRTLRLAVRRVPVRATSGARVPGSLAWSPRALRTWGPVRPVRSGVYGSEEATLCERPTS